MNFYDELGLPVSASAEEIRQAYKKLARLLHPDRQSDANLRRMAELQMTRLNEILTVLIDPARREHYDIALKAPPPAMPASLHMRAPRLSPLPVSPASIPAPAPSSGPLF